MRLVAVFALLAAASAAQDNQLTPAEKAGGWRLLFDGKTMKGWLDPAAKNVPGTAWTIEDGALTTVLKPRVEEDLISTDSFGDFELEFDWRVSERGNTGLKYRLQREIFVDNSTVVPGPSGFEGILGRELASKSSNRSKLAEGATGFVYTVAFEFQLIDDKRHPDALRGPDRQTGALYSMIPAVASPAKAAGEWNHARLVVRGKHVEHWVNGVQVLDASLDDPRVIAGVEKRWKPAPEILEDLKNPRLSGPIALQHHGDRVWFKNMKVRALKQP
jgi:hypothetical protein